MTETLDIRQLQKDNPFKDPLLNQAQKSNLVRHSQFKFDDDQLEPLKKSLISLIYDEKEAVVITNEKDTEKRFDYTVRISHHEMTYMEQQEESSTMFRLDFKSGGITVNQKPIPEHLMHTFISRVTLLISDIGNKKVSYFDE